MNSIVVQGLVARYRSLNPGRTVVQADDIFQPIWEHLSDPQKRKLGKEFYDLVVDGTFGNTVRFNRKNANGRAYYDI